MHRNPFRQFAFGLKLGLILLCLAMPLGVWLLCFQKLLPAMRWMPTLNTSTVKVREYPATKAWRVFDFREVDTGKGFGPISWARASSPTDDDVREFISWSKANESSSAKLAASSLAATQTPHDLGRTVAIGTITTAGRAAQLAVMIVVSVVCFAAYFPIISSLLGLVMNRK